MTGGGKGKFDAKGNAKGKEGVTDMKTSNIVSSPYPKLVAQIQWYHKEVLNLFRN